MDTVCRKITEPKYQMLKATVLKETGFVESINAFQSYRDTTDIGALDLAYKEAMDYQNGDHFPARNTWMWIYLEADFIFIDYLLVKLHREYYKVGRLTKEGYYDDHSKKAILQMTLPLSYDEFAYLLSLQINGISYKRFVAQVLRQIKYPMLLPLSEEIRKELFNALETSTNGLATSPVLSEEAYD